MDLVATDQLTEHPVIGALGPEPLSASFTPAVLARACRGRKTPIKVALLDQRIVAGLGNIYVVEALHRAGLSPFRRASILATKTGAPLDAAVRLVPQIKKVLTEAIARAGNASYRGGRFRVYDREGRPCLRSQCDGVIRRRTQAGRSTFACPVCQR
jgi:formamidopyrimidine-DNA glycosylase